MERLRKSRRGRSRRGYDDEEEDMMMMEGKKEG